MKVKRNSVIKFSFVMMLTLTVLTGLMFVDYEYLLTEFVRWAVVSGN